MSAERDLEAAQNPCFGKTHIWTLEEEPASVWCLPPEPKDPDRCNCGALSWADWKLLSMPMQGRPS